MAVGARRSMAGTALVLALVLGSLPTTRAAAGLPPSTVTIVALDDAVEGVAPCNDVLVHTPGRFEVRRPDGGPAVTIAYSVGGDAVADTDYEPLAGTVELEDDQRSVEVPVDPLPADAREVSLELVLQPGAGHTVGDPSSASILIRHLDGDCVPPVLSDAPTNRAQTIITGSIPVPLVLAPFAGFVGWIDHRGGELPSGVSLGRDGVFVGAAQQPGVYEARVGGCRGAVFFAVCSDELLTITVNGSALPSASPECAVERSAGEWSALQADVSADGRTIALLDFDGLLVVRGPMPGSERVVYERPPPRLGPMGFDLSGGGGSIVYNAQVQAQIGFSAVLVDLATGSRRVLTTQPGAVDSMALDHDGSVVGWTYRQLGGLYPDAPEGTFVLDRARDTTQVLEDAPPGGISFTPDGSTAVIGGGSRHSTISGVVDLVSGNRRPLGPKLLRMQSLAPDGHTYLGATELGFTGDTLSGVQELVRVDGRNGEVDLLTDYGSEDLEMHALSSDGSVVGFVTDLDLLGRNGDRTREAYLFDLRTNEVTQVTDHSGGDRDTNIWIDAIADRGSVVVLRSNVAYPGQDSRHLDLYVARCNTAVAAVPVRVQPSTVG